MQKSFTVKCATCSSKLAFTVNEAEGLEKHIQRERNNASEAMEAEFEGWIDPSDLQGSAALLVQLSVAVQRDDKAEATILLDRIAANLGDIVRERVEVARFSPQARLPLPHVPV